MEQEYKNMKYTLINIPNSSHDTYDYYYVICAEDSAAFSIKCLGSLSVEMFISKIDSNIKVNNYSEKDILLFNSIEDIIAYIVLVPSKASSKDIYIYFTDAVDFAYLFLCELKKIGIMTRVHDFIINKMIICKLIGRYFTIESSWQSPKLNKEKESLLISFLPAFKNEFLKSVVNSNTDTDIQVVFSPSELFINTIVLYEYLLYNK